jgi:hypothetical protein
MTPKFARLCLLLATAFLAAGCMTPGSQYLSPPGFSSTALKSAAVTYDPSWRADGKTW